MANVLEFLYTIDVMEGCKRQYLRIFQGVKDEEVNVHNVRKIIQHVDKVFDVGDGFHAAGESEVTWQKEFIN